MNSSLFYYIVFWIRLCRFQYTHRVFILVEVKHTSLIIGVVLKQMAPQQFRFARDSSGALKCDDKLKETAKEKKATKSK